MLVLVVVVDKLDLLLLELEPAATGIWWTSFELGGLKVKGIYLLDLVRHLRDLVMKAEKGVNAYSSSKILK